MMPSWVQNEGDEHLMRRAGPPELRQCSRADVRLDGLLSDVHFPPQRPLMKSTAAADLDASGGSVSAGGGWAARGTGRAGRKLLFPRASARPCSPRSPAPPVI